jgi:hypothetical protein
MGEIVTMVMDKIYQTGKFPTAWKTSVLHMKCNDRGGDEIFT